MSRVDIDEKIAGVILAISCSNKVTCVGLGRVGEVSSRSASRASVSHLSGLMPMMSQL